MSTGNFSGTAGRSKAEVGFLKLTTITGHADLQPRTELDRKTVLEYTGLLIESADLEFNPVILFEDKKGICWLADGYHRLKAYRTAGRGSIPAKVRPGEFIDAKEYSLSVNAKHGLRRNNDDKRRVVERALHEESWSDWSDAIVAEKCRVSRPYVHMIRKELEQAEELAPRTKRQGRDGKIRDVSNIGKTPRKPAKDKREEPTEEPVSVEQNGEQQGTIDRQNDDDHKYRLLSVKGRKRVQELHSMVTRAGEDIPTKIVRQVCSKLEELFSRYGQEAQPAG